MQESLTRPVMSYCQENDITLADVGLQVWTHPKCPAISNELIQEAMQLVLDQSRHPLLLMSSSGTHQVIQPLDH